MLQKKDEQRNVTLEQKLNKELKLNCDSSSSHNAKPNVARSAFPTSFCQTKFFYLMVLLNAKSQQKTTQKRCV